MEIQSFENGILKCSVNCVIVDGNVWFRGKDVAKALGYKDTAQAVRDNVEEEDRQKLEELVTVSDTITGYHEKLQFI